MRRRVLHPVAGALALLAQCRVSCRLCTETTQEPSACQDDWSFRDENGDKCTDWATFDCNEAIENGLTGAGVSPRASSASCMQEDTLLNQFFACSASLPSGGLIRVWCWSLPLPSVCWCTGQEVLIARCPETCGLCVQEEGTEASAICEDNKKFADELGSTCAAWTEYDCFKATQQGISELGQEDILAHCPRSCQLCQAAPKNQNSWAQPGRQHTAEAKEPAGCADNERFRDAQGYTCAGWAEYDCADAQAQGLSAKGQEHLFASCPKACGTCTQPALVCEDDASFVDEVGSTCDAWAEYDCKNALQFGISGKGKRELMVRCAETCGSCTESEETPTNVLGQVNEEEDLCEDDPTFKDAYGFVCSDCLDSLDALEELEPLSTREAARNQWIAACPESCGKCPSKSEEADVVYDARLKGLEAKASAVGKVNEELMETLESALAVAQSLKKERDALLKNLKRFAAARGDALALSAQPPNPEKIQHAAPAEPRHGHAPAKPAQRQSHLGAAAEQSNRASSRKPIPENTVCTDNPNFVDEDGDTCGDWKEWKGDCKDNKHHFSSAGSLYIYFGWVWRGALARLVVDGVYAPACCLQPAVCCVCAVCALRVFRLLVMMAHTSCNTLDCTFTQVGSVFLLSVRS